MSVLSNITIISGGQTGADRAALDFAIANGLPHGGWCPRGRRAEDGAIPAQYSMRETPSKHYAQRTRWNVRDSDATLVFSIAAEPRGGTRLTLDLARQLAKPVLHLSRDLAQADAASRLQSFLTEHAVAILNVAGPRASQEPDVAEFVHTVLATAINQSGKIRNSSKA